MLAVVLEKERKKKGTLFGEYMLSVCVATPISFMLS